MKVFILHFIARGGMVDGEEGINFDPIPKCLQGTYPHGIYFLLITHSRHMLDSVNLNVMLHKFLSEVTPTASRETVSKQRAWV
jgi:hypothetical protein